MKSPCLKSWHPTKTCKTLGGGNEARARAASFRAGPGGGPGGHPGCMVQPRPGVGALHRSCGAWRPGSCGAHLPMLAWTWGTMEGTRALPALLWVQPLRWGLAASLHCRPLSPQDRPLGFIWAQAAPSPVEAGGARVCPSEPPPWSGQQGSRCLACARVVSGWLSSRCGTGHPLLSHLVASSQPLPGVLHDPLGPRGPRGHSRL